jgi:DNA-binding CsgD family transcriptional regulator
MVRQTTSSSRIHRWGLPPPTSNDGLVVVGVLGVRRQPTARDDAGVSTRPVRTDVPLGLSLGAVAVAGVVVSSRVLTDAFWGTSYFVLLSSVVAAGILGRTGSAADRTWPTWRRAAVVTAALVLVYPGLWGVLGLVDDLWPGSRVTWGVAVLAGTAHLPIIASCSIFPLLAVRRLAGTSGRLIVGVTVLLFAAMASFALFFSEFDPFTAQPLVDWPPGEVIGATLNLLLLASVLSGPIVALRAAWRADSPGAQRLSRVALSALAGVGLVMVCGVVSASTGLGVVVMFVGMDAAVVAVVVGCTRALDLGDEVSLQATPSVGQLSPRESEVLALLAEGLSNAGVAERLVVSQRTIDAHVRSIFTKLGLPDGPHDNRRVHAVRVWHEAQMTK